MSPSLLLPIEVGTVVDDAKTIVVFDADKERIMLSSRLAEGGQGKVYRLESNDTELAKIYKTAEDLSKKQERLVALLKKETKRLAQVAAFPIKSLHNEQGETVGFLMENLKGWVPIHRIYQIKSRLSLMPESDFGTLLRVARNLSTCVHYMHEADIVIGDLNESNALVNGNAMVKLIDSDSVQVQVDGRTFTCDVGRPELIAPELQGHSLTGRIRTVEEDRFALAVLIFQILTFGRHPYAGQPRGSEEISLEMAIKNKWYPYVTGGNSRLKPPPGIELQFLNLEIRELFERAFAGEPNDRPTALEWFIALERTEESLEPCSGNHLHKYVDRGDGCPWCKFENHWRVPLFGSMRQVKNENSQVEIERLWNEIEGVQPPSTYEVPEMLTFEQVEPAPIRGSWVFGVSAWLVIGAVLCQVALQWLATFEQSVPWSLVAPLWIVCLFLVLLAVGYGRSKVRGARKAYEAAQAHFQEVLDAWHCQAGVEVFDDALDGLKTAKENLSTVEEEREIRRTTELRNLYRYEVENYLRKYSILVADIGVSSKQVLTRLHESGIQTAADLTSVHDLVDHKIGEQVARDLLKWRTRLEDAFWSTSPFQLSVAHEKRIEDEIRRESDAFRRRLLRGKEELAVLSETMVSQQRALGPQLHNAHYEMVQAAKNYKAWLKATGWSVPIND